MTAKLVVTALRSAIARRQPQGTVVVHSDRAGQPSVPSFPSHTEANRLVVSMGRVRRGRHNAAKESFYALLQNNVLNRQRRWRSRDELAFVSRASTTMSKHS